MVTNPAMTSTRADRKVISVPIAIVPDVEALIAVYNYEKSADAAREHLRQTLGQKLAQEVA